MPYFSEYNPCCCSIKNSTIAYNKKLNEKLNEIDLPNWSCPICYDDIQTKDQILCMVFDCSHLICYNCLYKMCIYTKKKKEKEKKLKCPLCRADTNEEWVNLNSVSMSHFKVDKKWCRMYIPT